MSVIPRLLFLINNRDKQMKYSSFQSSRQTDILLTLSIDLLLLFRLGGGLSAGAFI
jgi:hypothetical protein